MSDLKGKDLLSLADLSREEFWAILDLARQQKTKGHGKPLAGQTLAMLFEKPSLRTHVTFEVGMYQLGGHAIYLGPQSVGMGSRESPADVARNLERWVNGIAARVFAHHTLVELAGHAQIPVINGLSDLLHPCQILADCLTLLEHRGNLALRLVYVGDGNNIANSLVNAAIHSPLELVIATPRGFEPDPTILAEARGRGAKVSLTHDPAEAVANADAVYTDTWVSMGQEKEREQRLLHFKGFQVNPQLMSLAKRDALFLHCLPAHAGEEVAPEVIYGPQSVVFDQAENRLHAQKAVLTLLLG